MKRKWSGPLCFGTLLLALLILAGCDRDRDRVEERTAENGGEVQEHPPSPYEDPDVELVAPTDMGPEAPAIYFTAGLKGYTEPCGCTADVLLGGIDRIVAFGLDVTELHEEMVFIDAGDWIFEYSHLEEHMHPQEKAKAEVLADAHRKLGTRFSVPGARDLALGVEYYRSMMSRAEMEILATNLIMEAGETEKLVRMDFDGKAVVFLGITAPEEVDGIAGLEAMNPAEALGEALQEVGEQEVAVMIFQGDREAAEALMEEVEGVDLLILGKDPLLRAEADWIQGRPAFQAHDQGRYVGRLKLYNGAQSGEFLDARASIREERKALQAQIDHVEQDLRLLEVRTGGERTPMVERLEERLAGLERQQEELLREGIEIPEEGRAFLFDLIPMEPGFRLDQEVREQRLAYNRSLAELNRDLQREVPPVEEGEAFYIGTAECAACHIEAHRFWEETRHASAVATLEAIDKDFDQNCIGCHVVGWEEPGGSVLGKLVYEAELGGRVFEKDLNNVGCESCHGPGSNHRLQPVDGAGIAQHIIREPTAVQCSSCHVPEHSPRFDFDVYVLEITGEGHEFRSGGEGK